MKRNFLLFVLVILALLGLLAGKFFIWDRRTLAWASIRVESYPTADVFIDGQKVGVTPFVDEKIAPGEYQVRISPPPGSVLAPWEGKAKLFGGAVTYVSFILAADSDLSSGQVLTLERGPFSKTAELSVVSFPDQALVLVDNQEKGTTSLIIRDLSLGDHDVVVSKTGYSDQQFHGKLSSGFRLNAVVKLARIAKDGQVSTASGAVRPTNELIPASAQTGPAKPYIVVKDTPLGFLRVRFGPDINASEVGRVRPGERYPLLEEENFWTKIKLATFSGWVSDNYIEKVK